MRSIRQLTCVRTLTSAGGAAGDECGFTCNGTSAWSRGPRWTWADECSAVPSASGHFSAISNGKAYAGSPSSVTVGFTSSPGDSFKSPVATSSFFAAGASAASVDRVGVADFGDLEGPAMGEKSFSNYGAEVDTVSALRSEPSKACCAPIDRVTRA